MAQNAAVPAFLSLNKHGRGWRFGHLELIRPNREVILGHYFRLGVMKVRAGSGLVTRLFPGKRFLLVQCFTFIRAQMWVQFHPKTVLWRSMFEREFLGFGLRECCLAAYEVWPELAFEGTPNFATKETGDTPQFTHVL